jgi:hypothetical protein
MGLFISSILQYSFGSWHIICFCLLAEVLLSLQPHLPVDLIALELLMRHSSSLIAAYDHFVMILSTNTACLDPLWVYLFDSVMSFFASFMADLEQTIIRLFAPSVRSWWSQQGSNGSWSLPFTMNVMVWYFVSDSQKVMTQPDSSCYVYFGLTKTGTIVF